MAKKSFAEETTSAQLLVEALNKREGNMPVGVTEELKNQLNTSYQQAVQTNVEQEKLKALLKEKTAELDKHLNEMRTTYTHLKKYIKMGISKELWKEFCIEDKR